MLDGRTRYELQMKIREYKNDGRPYGDMFK
jgi:hypothetical protein